ncbi:hypothetical protein HYX58_03545 [Candidatus Dependentiae bacterium]|nr:hypothetical protein [Candidatus Dependentiae bacterium]
MSKNLLPFTLAFLSVHTAVNSFDTLKNVSPKEMQTSSIAPKYGTAESIVRAQLDQLAAQQESLKQRAIESHEKSEKFQRVLDTIDAELQAAIKKKVLEEKETIAKMNNRIPIHHERTSCNFYSFLYFFARSGRLFMPLFNLNRYYPSKR